MTDKEIKEIIEVEFQHKTLGVTEQFLKIHSPIYIDGHIHMIRVDREGDHNVIVAYLPVLDQRFYFAVYIDTQSKEIFNLGSEAYHRV